MSIKIGETLAKLCPEGGWIISGDSFDGITWIDDRPRCTKAEFEEALAQYDDWKANQAAAKADEKVALLERLGITADEAALLLG